MFSPLHFLCEGRLPGGMNKNNHILIGRCIVAMVTADDDALTGIKNGRTGQKRVVSSIDVIHRYNPSRKLNRRIKITTKQMRVCDDSELSLWLNRALRSVEHG